MKITVIGTGYVGLVTGTCLAEVGNDVLCIDINTARIDRLNQGHIPIFEPGLEELVARNLLSQRLRFSTDIQAGVQHGEFQFITVGTPPCADGSVNLEYVDQVARSIGQHMQEFKIVINKSTVPIGTADAVKRTIHTILQERQLDIEFTVVSNPEFLKEGAAVEDFMRPDRIVLGTDADAAGQRSLARLKQLYAPFNRHTERTFCMNVRSAEFTKYAANAMLATRISLMNEFANLAETVGADIEQVRTGIGSDPRIGPSFLYAGAGYGGSCFPKDVRALIHLGQTQQQPLHILEAVDATNNAQRQILFTKIIQRFGADLSALTFAVWGLSFKPNTDDLREAPAILLIQKLLQHGATVRAYDPVAIPHAQDLFAAKDHSKDQMARLTFCTAREQTMPQADALIIVTEWKEFRSPDFDAMRAALRQPVIFDGRNLFEPDWMQTLGFEYHGIGRTRA